MIFGSTNSQNFPRFLSMTMMVAPRIIPARGDYQSTRKCWKRWFSLFRNRPMKPMNRCYQIAIEFIVDIGCWGYHVLFAAYRQSNMVCWKNPPLSSIILNMPRFSSLNADLWCTSPASHAWLPEGNIHFLWFVLCLIRKDMDTHHFEEMNHWTTRG